MSTVDPTPDDLGIAVVTRFHDVQALVDGFPGGIYRAKSNPGAVGSQLVFKITRAKTSFVSEDTEFLNQTIRFTCLSGDSNEAGRLRALVEDAYGGKSIDHEAGWTTPLYVSNRSEDEETRPAKPEYAAFKAVVEFEFHEHRGA